MPLDIKISAGRADRVDDPAGAGDKAGHPRIRAPHHRDPVLDRPHNGGLQVHIRPARPSEPGVICYIYHKNGAVVNQFPDRARKEIENFTKTGGVDPEIQDGDSGVQARERDALNVSEQIRKEIEESEKKKEKKKKKKKDRE